MNSTSGMTSDLIALKLLSSAYSHSLRVRVSRGGGPREEDDGEEDGGEEDGREEDGREGNLARRRTTREGVAGVSEAVDLLVVSK